MAESNYTAQYFLTLYKLHRDEFISWSQKTYDCSIEEAKDAFQEAMVDLYADITEHNSFKGQSSIKTYLFSIGRNKLLNALRKSSRTVTFSNIDVTKVMEPNEDSINDEHSNTHNEEFIRKYLNLQCEDCQRVLRSFYMEGKDMATIASEMGYKNSDVAKKKKYECFKKFAQVMKNNVKTFVL
ncbi:MAG: sigma-70 family RNA polymerase sigma factor [Bacteroidetes bacterium]|nr:sigma-70 family RNA polymerase sigma factor [Bacteroidota bacterium]